MQNLLGTNPPHLYKPQLFLPLVHSPLKTGTDYLLCPATGYVYCLTTGCVYTRIVSSAPLSVSRQHSAGKKNTYLNDPKAPLPEVKIKAEKWEEAQSKSSKKRVKVKNVQDHAIKGDKPATFLNQAKIKHKLPKEAIPVGNKNKLSVKKVQSQPVRVTDPSIILTQNNNPETKSKPHLTTQGYQNVESKSTQNKYVQAKKKKKGKKKKTKLKKKAQTSKPATTQTSKPATTSDNSGSNRTRPPRKRKTYPIWPLTFRIRFNRRPRAKTHQQHHKKQPVWANKCKNCLKASSVHDIVNSPFINKTSKRMPIYQLRSMLSSGGRKLVADQEWMKSMEKEAIRKYKIMKLDCKQKVQLTDYRVVTHPEKPWLVGLCMWVIDRHTKEKWPLLVKCLYKYPDSTIRQASKQHSGLSWNEVDYSLRSDHTYYTQMQCLLAITDKVYAELLVHTHKETTIVPVYFDADFWEETEDKVEAFFVYNVLPYLKDKKKTEDSKLDIIEESENEVKVNQMPPLAAPKTH